MTIEELVDRFYHKLNGPDDATAEDAMSVVVRALRDEMFCNRPLRSASVGHHCQEVFNEILGSDAGAATAGAIQPQGETENGFRRSIEGPEDGAASGAFGLERQGHVPVSGERINLHREPPTASGNIPGRDSDRLPAPHRHEDGGQQVRAVVGVADGLAGRRLGDSGLNEKVAGGSTREDEKAVEAAGDKGPVTVNSPATAPAPVTIKETIAGTVLRMEQGYTGGMNDLSVTPATDPAPTVGQRLIKAAHEAAAIARGDMQPGRVYATDPAPAVCEWREISVLDGIDHYSTKHGVKNRLHLYRKDDVCPVCLAPIKFTEAK